MWRRCYPVLTSLSLSLFMGYTVLFSAEGESESPPPVVFFNLTEAFRRLEIIKEKPRGEMFRKYLLRSDGTVQPELLIFKDPETGREVWRLTHDFSRNTPHCHINRSPWNSNGSLFAFNSDRWFSEETSSLSPQRIFLLNADGSGMRNLTPRLDGNPFLDIIAYARHVVWDRDDPNLMYFVDREWFYQAQAVNGFPVERIGRLEPPGRRREIYSYPSDNDIIMVKDRGSQEYQACLYFFDMKKNSPNYRKMIYSYPFTMDINDPFHKKTEEWHIHDITFRRDPGDHYVLNYGPFDKVGEPIFFDFPLDGDREKIRLSYAEKHGMRPYFSHPAWAAGGELVAYFGEGERGDKCFGLHVWDYKNDRHLVELADAAEAGGGHIAWDGYDRENFFASPSQVKEYSLGGKIIWAHLDGRKPDMLCTTNTKWQVPPPGEEHDYCAIARPAQSPDGTKCFFSSTAMQPEIGAYDCYLVVARRPAPPQELSAVGQGKGVLLSWKPHDLSREVKEYHVYRIVNDVNSFLLLGTCPPEKLTYLDEPLEIDTTYYYTVTSEEFSGLESDRLSPVIEVKVGKDYKLQIRTSLQTGQRWDNILPEPPSRLKAIKAEPGKYFLEWEASPSADLRYYDIYYSPDSRPPSGQEYLIATLPRGETSFFDWGARKNKKAHYAIIAVDKQDNLSEPVFYDEP